MEPLKTLKAASSFLKVFGARLIASKECMEEYTTHVRVPVQKLQYIQPVQVCSSTFNVKTLNTPQDELVFTVNRSTMSREACRPVIPRHECTCVNVNYPQIIEDRTSDMNKLSCLRTETKCTCMPMSNHISENSKRRKTSRMAAFAIAGGCLSLKKKRRKTNQTIAENASLLGSENLDQSITMDPGSPPSTHDENRAKTTESINNGAETVENTEPLTSEAKGTEENPACRFTSVLTHGQLDCCIESEKTEVREDCKSSDNKSTNLVGISPVLITKGSETRSNPPISTSELEEVYNLQFLFDEKRSGKKRKRTSTDTESGKKKIERPNYFVGIQISDKTVQNNLQTVQDAIIEDEKKLKPALINLSTLHLTLIVMQLEEEEEVERASQVLKKCYEEVAEDFTQKPVQLEFEGISDFKRQVLFAKIKPSDALERVQKLADLIEENFKNSGIPLPGFKDFKPHATIVKLSKAPKLRYRGIKGIDKNLYKDFLDSYFGSQYVNSLQLLSMTKPKTEDGYYHCEKDYIFDIPEGLSSCIDSQLNRTEVLRKEISSSKKEVKRKISDLTRAQLENIDKK